MRRVVPKVMVFLVLGAMVNVAVAWSYWWWPDSYHYEEVSEEHASALWRQLERPSWAVHQRLIGGIHTSKACLTCDELGGWTKGHRLDEEPDFFVRWYRQG
jgi:hypothetical protein